MYLVIICFFILLITACIYKIYFFTFEGDFQNSIFSELEWQGKNVMIIVPHQDDEINLAGATIKNLIDHKIRVTIVFATNSDTIDQGETRLKEALATAAFLGLTSDNIIFLGYCNGFRITPNLHFYNADENIVVHSAKNLTETYGLINKPEYCYQTTGQHKKYTKKNLRTDLKQVILQYKPDLIFSVDYDRHPDHKAISLLFEECMSEILHMPENSYFPEVYKGFCYNGSYLGKKDFYKINLQETMQTDKNLLNDPNYETDWPPYNWQERVRLPVPKVTLSRTLNSNFIYKALRRHFTQGIIHNAKRIINSDQVFWKRPTTSLSYQASITTSSGNPDVLTDFKLCDCPDILSPTPLFSGAWIPNTEDRQKKITFSFSCPQTISKIILYTTTDRNSNIDNITINFNNTYSEDFGPLNNYGKATIISFDPQYEISELSIALTNTSGTNAGLTEVEIFSDQNEKSLLRFIKIMVSNNFVYDYWIPANCSELLLELYKYGITEKINLYSVNNDDYTLSGNKLSLGPDFKKAIIRAEASNHPLIYDQIVIRKKSAPELFFTKLVQFIDMFFHRCEHIAKSKYIKWFRIK